MVLVHGLGADDPLGEVVMVGLEIEEKVFHGAAGAGGGAEEDDFIRAGQGLGDGFVEALELRLALAIGIVLVVMQGTAEAVGIVGGDALRRFAVEFGFKDACLAVVDDHEEVQAAGCGGGGGGGGGGIGGDVLRKWRIDMSTSASARVVSPAG